MEQQMTDLPGSWFGLVPFILMVLMVGIPAHFLAKEKGRNVVLWTVLGCIPFFNFFFIWFFVGAANLKVERKLDQLLEQKEIAS